MNLWINAILYQATWLLAIAGAARSCWWAGPLALAIFAAWQFSVSLQRRADGLLVASAAAIGFAIDSVFAQTGLITYATAVPWEHLAPVWIVALWISFALTFNHSLAYLKTHPLVASALGGIGAPLAYLAAAHWGALTLPATQWPSLAVLAVVWALLTPALGHLAQQFCVRNPVTPLALHGGQP
jgi:Protein of unknown function (DUF2878)